MLGFRTEFQVSSPEARFYRMPSHVHRPPQRRDSISSVNTTVTGLSGEEDERSVLKAVERAKEFKLCLRRIWAVAASLSDRERSLPSLIPSDDTFSVPSHSGEHHEHEQCT